jgi:CHASE3 domain sensor protein
MDCQCTRGAWNCASRPVVTQALADNGNTLSASSANSADAVPSYGIALIVLGALILVMLLVVIVQLVVFVRS